MVRVVGARQRFCRSPLEVHLHRAPLGPHFGEAQRIRPRASDDDQINARRQKFWPEAKALPAEPLDPIAVHGATDFARDDQAQARRARWARLGRNEQSEMGSAHPTTRPLRAYELRVLAQPAVAPEVGRHYFL